MDTNTKVNMIIEKITLLEEKKKELAKLEKEIRDLKDSINSDLIDANNGLGTKW